MIVKIEGCPRRFDLADGSLSLGPNPETGYHSAECFLEYVEMYSRQFGRVTVLEVSD